MLYVLHEINNMLNLIIKDILNFICQISKMKLNNFYPSEYLDYCLHPHCNTHNVSADMQSFSGVSCQT